jgi:hypothetical protein
MKHLSLLLLTATALHAMEPADEKNPKLHADAKVPKNVASAVQPEQHRGPWTLSAGVQWRQFGHLSFDNGSAQAWGFHLPASPSHSGIATYKDGFVSPDIGGSDSTWNWGYANAGQLNGNTLTFHGTQITGSTMINSFNTDWSDTPNGAGVFLKLQSQELLRVHGISLSASLGYSWSRADSSNDAVAFRAEQQTLTNTVTDRFDVTGVAVPPAPYSGSFVGPGPTIGLNPSKRSIDASNAHIDEVFTSTLHSSLRTDLHTFSFGPDAAFDFKRVRVGVSSGLALNIANWTADTREDLRNRSGLMLASWQHHETGTEVLPGYFIEANASYAISPRWSLVASARYDWAQSLRGHVGGSSFDLGLSGWTLGLGASYKF